MTTTEERKPKRTVAALRAERNLSLPELAERTGIPERVLRMIDHRHYRASPKQVEKLCAALGVEPDEIDIGLPKTEPGMYGSGGRYN